MKFIAWRIAFYVPGNVSDVSKFVLLLTQYIKHRAANSLAGADRKPWPSLSELKLNIHMHPSCPLSLDRSDIDLPECTVHAPCVMLPAGIFDASPPLSNKVRQLSIVK